MERKIGELNFHIESEVEFIMNLVNELLKLNSDLQFEIKEFDEMDDNEFYHHYLLIRKED